MIRTMNDFFKSYNNVRNSTLAIFDSLTDDNLKQAIVDGHRTLAEIAWHIVVTTAEMMNRTGLELSSIDEESPPPATAAEIVDGYRKVSQELTEALKFKWSDETLLETDNMYGQDWARGTTLQILLNHEIHHRGQMTVLLRQAGAMVKGTMGPSKDEWEKFGMDLPAY